MSLLPATSTGEHRYTSRHGRRLGTAVLLVAAAAVALAGFSAPARAQSPLSTFVELGRYEAQSFEGPDHLMASVVVNDDVLAVSSAIGIALVDRAALAQGTVKKPLATYRVDFNEPSNLDGAPAGDVFFPKFFSLARYGDYLYAASRYDGLWIFRMNLQTSPPRINKVGRHMRPREFTEGVQVLGDLLYLTHHADGIEVMDLSADPAKPVSLGTLKSDLVDSWGIAPDINGDIWVADGAGGLKLVRQSGGVLTLVTGDTLETSPGILFDAAMSGNWVVAAAGGQGIAIYDRGTATLEGTTSLPGVCLDVEPMPLGRLAVACRSWLHIIRVDVAGQVKVLASTRLHRDFEQGKWSLIIGSHVTWAADTLYASNWDEVAAYAVTNSLAGGPDLYLKGQRAHFPPPPSTLRLDLGNSGLTPLKILNVTCPAPIQCALGAGVVNPGATTFLDLTYNGSQAEVNTELHILSDDPDEPLVSVQVYAKLERWVDPGEVAPTFAGSAVQRNYQTAEVHTVKLSLAELAFRDEAVHFAIFGTWCPACLPVVTSSIGDVLAKLPEDAEYFLVDQQEPLSVMLHVMEKVYLPLPIYLDLTGKVGNRLYSQPNVGLPFSRSYVVDREGVLTRVFTGYEPSAVLQAIAEIP